MEFSQQLSIEDYYLYLRETIFSNKLYKSLRVVGIAMFLLILVKLFRENFTYDFSINGLILITLLVFFIPHLSYYKEKKQLSKASYLPDILESHRFFFFEEKLEIQKGKTSFQFEANEIYSYSNLPHFLVIKINEVSHFPIPKYLHSKEKITQMLHWLNATNNKLNN